MNNRSRRWLLILLLAVLIPRTGRAEVIVLSDYRDIAGSTGIDLQSGPGFYQTTAFSPPGRPWTAADRTGVGSGRKRATVAAQQSSVAGPLRYIAEARVSAKAFAPIGQAAGSAYGSANTRYVLDIVLSSPYRFAYSASAFGDSLQPKDFDRISQGHVGFLGNGDIPVVPTISSSNGERGHVSRSGVLEPGHYRLFGSAVTIQTAGSDYGADEARGSGEFSLSLLLEPAGTVVPEPSTIVMMAVALTGVRWARRRRQ